MVKNLQYFVVLTGLALTFLCFKLPPKTAGNGIKVVVIDPGHGGKDPGCQGSIHREKDVALAVALKLGKYIEDNFKDVKVVYTRTTDVFVELEDRAQIANKAKADLFISIHCNAAGKPVMVKDPKTGKKRPKTYKNKKGKLVVVETTNPIPFGTETYVMGLKNEEGKMKVATRENSAIFYEEDYEKKYGGFDPESEESYIIMSNYTSAYVIQSANLAMKFQDEYAKKAGRIDKGVHRQSIWVLWRTSMPSILTEIGYLTNPLEEKFLGSEKGQEYLAKAMFRGFRKYKDELEGTKKDYNDEFENQVALENENVKEGNVPGSKKSQDDDDDEPKTSEVADVLPKADSLALEEEKDVAGDKPDPVKQKVDDDRYADIKIKQKDTALVAIEKTNDKSSGSAEVIKNFKKQNDAGEKKEPVKTNSSVAEVRAEKEKELADIKKKEESLKNEIYFKVQFATSDIALNLKHDKFAAVTDADFYKVNNTLKYTSGKFLYVKDAFAHQTFLREKGFKDCFVIAQKNGQRIDLNEARKLTGQ